jgi:hypothetical protein
VVGRLIEWLAAPAHDSLRRAFVVWLKRVLLPARAPGVELPPSTTYRRCMRCWPNV